jgi:hypothetical protein
LKTLLYPRRLVTTFRACTADLVSEDYVDSTNRLIGGFGWSDTLALLVHPTPGTAVVVGVPLEHQLVLPTNRRRFLKQIALHIEAAMRIRACPAALVGVLSSDGQLVHCEGPPEQLGPGPAGLAARVARIESVRARHSQDPDALRFWEALVTGDLSLVPVREGTRRQYLVMENAPSRQPLRALTKAELDVVSYASRGLSVKNDELCLGGSGIDGVDAARERGEQAGPRHSDGPRPNRGNADARPACALRAHRPHDREERGARARGEWALEQGDRADARPLAPHDREPGGDLLSKTKAPSRRVLVASCGALG